MGRKVRIKSEVSVRKFAQVRHRGYPIAPGQRGEPVALPKSSSGAGLPLDHEAEIQVLQHRSVSASGKSGIGRLRTFEQTGGWGTPDQRNHGEGAPRQSDEKNGAQISFSGADSVVLAISAEKDRNLRVDLPVVYARIGRCQGRPAWRGYAALL